MTYLLDANVLSETRKRQPSPGVTEWISATPPDLLHVSVLTLGEIEQGIARIRGRGDKWQAAAAERWLRDVEAGTELLGAGQGLAIAYRPQGAGLLSFDFGSHPPILLHAGRRYALALQGDKGALTLFLRASRDDRYADGEASLDDRPLKDRDGHRIDFAFALYPLEGRGAGEPLTGASSPASR